MHFIERIELFASLDTSGKVVDHRVHEILIESHDKELGMAEIAEEPDGVGKSRSFFIRCHSNSHPSMTLDICQ